MRYLKVSVASLATMLASSAFAQVKDREKGLEEVVVKGVINKKSETAILQDQKKSVVLKQTVGTEEISRKGIANVEEGLTKVSGVTTVEGQGVVIRGLDARYNFLLVNQLATPSNNPFEKIIPLKQIPTNIVGGIDIFKTYNPDLYGDFAGATINLETKQSSNAFTNIGFSLGYTTNNNFRDFLISPDANTMRGFVGLNDQNRKLSSYFGDKPSAKRVDPTINSRVFKTGFNVDQITSPLNSGMSFSHGNKHKFGTGKDYFAYVISANHSSSYSYREGEGSNWQRVGEREVNNIFRFKKISENNYKTLTSGLLATTLQTGALKLDWNTFFIQDNQNLIKDQLSSENYLIRSNQQEISRLLNTQLLANYKFNDRNNLKVGASYVYTSFGQPDRKALQVRLNEDNSVGTIGYGGANFQRQFFDLKTNGYYSGMAEYSFKLGQKNENNEYSYNIALGYNGFYDSRVSSYRFMRNVSPRNTSRDFSNINQIDDVLRQDNLANEFYFEESSEATYKAQLKSMVNAAYASINYKPSSSWDLMLGLRGEQAGQEISYKPKGLVGANFISVKTNKLFFLPSLNIKKALNNQSNLRLAASKSLTRSIMMERFPVDYVNPDGTSVQGNPNLRNSENYNLDLKYEIFPSKKELLAIGVYGKKLINPIERTSMSSASGDGFIFTYINAKEAVILGAEVDAVIDLDKQINLKNFSLGFNASYMYTNVVSNNALGSSTTSGFETFEKRPLQGASPWLINADLKYEFAIADTKNTASLVYNVYAKRIYSIGVNRMDHLYENPFHSLDLVWISKLSKHWETNFSVSNILNPMYRVEMGQNGQVDLAPGVGYTFREYKRGVGFGLSVNYKF